MTKNIQQSHPLITYLIVNPVKRYNNQTNNFWCGGIQSITARRLPVTGSVWQAVLTFNTHLKISLNILRYLQIFRDISKSFRDISKSFRDISKSFRDISKCYKNTHITSDDLQVPGEVLPTLSMYVCAARKPLFWTIFLSLSN